MSHHRVTTRREVARFLVLACCPRRLSASPFARGRWDAWARPWCFEDARIFAKVQSELGGGAVWPEPMFPLNPTVLRGGTVDELVGERYFHP